MKKMLLSAAVAGLGVCLVADSDALIRARLQRAREAAANASKISAPVKPSEEMAMGEGSPSATEVEVRDWISIEEACKNGKSYEPSDGKTVEERAVYHGFPKGRFIGKERIIHANIPKVLDELRVIREKYDERKLKEAENARRRAEFESAVIKIGQDEKVIQKMMKLNELFSGVEEAEKAISDSKQLDGARSTLNLFESHEDAKTAAEIYEVFSSKEKAIRAKNTLDLFESHEDAKTAVEVYGIFDSKTKALDAQRIVGAFDSVDKAKKAMRMLEILEASYGKITEPIKLALEALISDVFSEKMK